MEGGEKIHGFNLFPDKWIDYKGMADFHLGKEEHQYRVHRRKNA